MSEFVKVATTQEIPVGEGKKVEVGGKEVAIFNVNGNFYAIDDLCPHRGGPLSEGQLDGNVVACGWHGWQFDVTTGVCPGNPAAKVSAYNLKVEGNDILLES